MKDVISRNNHYLSQMYLKAWKNKKNEVYIYDLLVPNDNCPLWRSKPTRSVGSYDSMFVRLKDGIEVDDIEKWFRDRYETPAEKALEHAINDEVMAEEEWHCLIDLVACHIVRSPRYIFKVLDIAKKDCVPIFEETCDEISNITKDDILNNNENSNNNSNELFPLKIANMGADEQNDSTLFKIETIFGKQFYLWNVINILNDTAKIFHQNKWGIITVDDSVKLPTSDNPVICLDFRSENDYNFNGGWGRENCNILMPISPNKILFTQVGTKVLDKMKLNYQMSLLFKKMIVEHGYKTIVSSFKDDEIVKLRKRFVSEEEYLREKQMWKDFQKDYLEKEKDYIRKTK